MSAPAPQKIIFTNDITPILVSLAAEMTPSSVFVVTDANVAAKVLPSLGLPSEWEVIAVPPGDTNKDLDSLALIWRSLTSGGATRKSLVVNIGGGVVTDMGGFAAATFKRGVRFINVPTTLLSAVDAAVGGKTGINFEGYKNEIGVFANADAVVISTVTFSTLPPVEILSGYAEMIKHSLLEDRESFGRLLAFDISEADADRLLHLLEESVRVKERIVT
ncbi:MAG: 3-dehydroquinate synthase, partial [Duncaniella sp.]|nr:3-dehydroquinate synthase [Duncaniella sp.]